MKTIKNILVAASLLMVAAPAFAEVPLQKTRSVRDTVFTNKFNLVMLTSPSAKATVNGEEVHVYKSGAFGTALELSEGVNKIEVTVSEKGETKSETVEVTYLTRPQGFRRGPEARRPDVWNDMLMYGVTGKGAFLKFGNGDERLGGTKMGYLEPGIPLKLVACNDRMYKVQLSNNRAAYIDKQYVSFANVNTNVINSDNISVSNTGKTDDIYVGLPSKVAYYSWVDMDPTILYVDLYGVTNNSNWITHKPNLGMVDYVDVRQVEGDVLRLVIRLKYKYSWGYHISYHGNSLVISVKHTPNLTLNGMTVTLDAGHGGPYPGALGYTGLEEKVVNLQLVEEVKKILESKGATVILTRDEDEDVDDRVVAAGNPDLLISIHNNSGGSPFAQLGTSSYYKHISNRDFAACILNRLLECGQNCFGLVGNFNFNLCKMTEYPCMLIEGLFMNSLAEEEKLLDPAFRKQFAQKAVAGVEDYLELVKASMPAAPKKTAKKK